MSDESLCFSCKHLLHYKYDREVDLSCFKGQHEPRAYPPVTKCEDYEKKEESMTDELFKCPECGRECMIEFENEKVYKLRCIHCLKDIVRWKNE